MDITDHVARRVRTLRTAQGLTLDTLAQRTGLPPETLSRIERKRIVPSIRSLDRLAAGLGVPLAVLLSDEPVATVSGDSIPAEVRGVALLLAGKSARTIDKVRRIVQVLLEDDSASPRPPG